VHTVFQMEQLTLEALSTVFPYLTTLNVSGGEFHTVGAFSSLHNLQLLDLSECHVLDFPNDVFQGTVCFVALPLI